ncbi:MAG TPA: type II toxin-antitoxin system CcdA family antitoxin [Acetobacteraceae bacterium]
MGNFTCANWQRELAMSLQLYDQAARRRTVSISINSDLADKAASAGVNLSRTAEAAIAAAFVDAERQRAGQEAAEAARITEELVAKYGHPFAEWIADYLPEEGDANAA